MSKNELGDCSHSEAFGAVASKDSCRDNLAKLCPMRSLDLWGLRDVEKPRGLPTNR